MFYLPKKFSPILIGLFTGLLDFPSRTLRLFIVVDKDRVPDVGQQLPDGPMQKVDSHQRERIRDQPKTGVPGGNQKFPCLVRHKMMILR